jgi:SAM-dependent MidA family methyltransferase
LEWNGVLFANEVIDALQTPRFAIRDGEVFEETVVVEARSLRAHAAPGDAFLGNAVRQLERSLERSFAKGYRSEVLPQLPYWIQACRAACGAARLLFVDYGHPRGEFYQPTVMTAPCARTTATACMPTRLLWPGLQDLTASVDFTALAEAGVARASTSPATARRRASCWATAWPACSSASSACTTPASSSVAATK